jgi:hypothetical protein
MLTTPLGSPASRQISAKRSAVSEVYSAGFRTTVFPAASAGAIFHASIRSGKFHGMIWPQTPRAAVREFFCKKLRQARVVVEMPLRQGHVDVAALADRLAVVEGFQHREEAGMLLQKAGQRVEVFRALMCPERRAHFGKARAAAFDGGVDILRRALGDLGQRLAGGGVLRGEGLARAGEAAVDEMPEDGSPVGDPGADLGVAFGGGAVFHGVEDLAGGHPDRRRAAPMICAVPKENCSFLV